MKASTVHTTPSTMVSVLMPTYKHAPYISQAIESFLAQEVHFTVELLINDDCSPDNTYEIAVQYAAQYPDKIRVFHQDHNQGLMRNYQFLLQQATGKYLAVLESDDYWVDVHKLQKQVDYLEVHPTCHLSFSGVWFLKDDGSYAGKEAPFGVMEENQDATYLLTDTRRTPYEHIMYRNVIFSPSVVFRKAAYEKYCSIADYILLDFKTFDYPVWLSLLAHGELHYLRENTAVYRIMSTSISNTSNLQKRLNFERSIIDIRSYIRQLYGQGHFKNWQIHLRQAVVCSRCAWRLKKPLSAAWYFFVMFFR